MADEYTLTFTGGVVQSLLDMLNNSGVTQTQLGYLNGLTGNVQSQISAQTASLNNHTQPVSRVTGGTFSGSTAVVANSSAVSNLTTKQIRNITISTSEPTSGTGNNGDIWIVYES